MEFPFNIEQSIPTHLNNGIFLLDASSSSTEFSSTTYMNLCHLLDKVGHLSALVLHLTLFNVHYSHKN